MARANKWRSFLAADGQICDLKHAGSTAEDEPLYRKVKVEYLTGEEGRQSANFWPEDGPLLRELNEVNYEAWTRH